jgi:hypothetical protein
MRALYLLTSAINPNKITKSTHSQTSILSCCIRRAKHDRRRHAQDRRHLRYSRLKRDGRTREARLVKRLRNDLIAQCGGTVSASQRLLIDRIASLSLRINLLDSDVSEHTGREYLDLTVTLAQLLAQLGVQPAAAPSSIMPASSPQHEVAA